MFFPRQKSSLDCIMWLILGFSLCILVVQAVDWSERYDVDPRRSALVWTTGHNISLVVCPSESTTALSADRRSVRADHSVIFDLFPESALSGDQHRELRRREERVKSIFDNVIGDTRIISQDRARLLGELIGEVISKCMREAGATAANSATFKLEPTYIDGLVLPLGGALARLFLERPPPSENVAERHLDLDLGANTFLRINSMQNTSIVRTIVGEVHWEAFARHGIKVLGNTMSREEYLDAVGLSTGITMSLIQQINGTVLRQDVITTSRKYVGNFLKAYLLMSNQYFSFMDYSISWLADDIAIYMADDILRLRSPIASGILRQEWTKYAAEANKGLRNMRLISVGLLLSYRNGANDIKFQSSDALGSLVPPSWMALKYLFPEI